LGILPERVGATAFSAAGIVYSLASPVGAAGAGGVLGLSARSQGPNASRPEPLAALPPSGGMSLLVTILTVLAGLVGVVALARLTVGEDFFSLRWLR
jgi:hypothetical protein